MNAFDASYFESSETEAQIADPRRDVSVPDFAIEGQLPLSLQPRVGFLLPYQLVTVVGYM
jgi:hypothetical protein